MSLDPGRLAADPINDLLEILKLLPRKEQIALRRFYCDGDADELICAELDLDIEDFRQLRADLRAHYRRLTSGEDRSAGRLPQRRAVLLHYRSSRRAVS